MKLATKYLHIIFELCLFERKQEISRESTQWRTRAWWDGRSLYFWNFQFILHIKKIWTIRAHCMYAKRWKACGYTTMYFSLVMTHGRCTPISKVAFKQVNSRKAVFMWCMCVWVWCAAGISGPFYRDDYLLTHIFLHMLTRLDVCSVYTWLSNIFLYALHVI